MSIPFANSWILLGVGVVVWFISATTGYRNARDKVLNKSTGFSKFLSVFGIALILLGVFTGLRGPISIGPLTLQPFSFASSIGKRDVEALKYAGANLKISGKPAHGWHGGSTKTLQYSVNNTGDKRIYCIFLRFATTQGTLPPYVDLKLNGPFPARRKSRSNVSVPKNVSRSYFDSGRTAQIVGARF